MRSTNAAYLLIYLFLSALLNEVGIIGATVPPVVILPNHLGNDLIILPDGSWESYPIRVENGRNTLTRRRSNDYGRTWSEPEELVQLPVQGVLMALLDRRLEVQLFLLVQRLEGAGKKIATEEFNDIWQLRSSSGRTQWSKPRRIFPGYVGSLQGAIQLKSGRILVPFAWWIPGRVLGPPAGPHYSTTIYSDDDGETWTLSPAKITAPCYDGYNGESFGAVEPMLLELRDGRIWMLIRTQTGFLYESFSKGGINWSEAWPTRFRSPDAPCFLLRLHDQSIALIWNQCEVPPRVQGEGVYGGRDVLHGAISKDEGKTWRGFREVYRDPLRNASPPAWGDRGTAYPFGVVAKDARIALVTGQGEGRRSLVLIEPGWLLETEAFDDFSHGLEEWSVYKPFGPAKRWWRDREQGAQLIENPTRPGTKVLHLSKKDDKAADGAVWNFPSGRKGTLTVRAQFRKGFQGAVIVLLDRFIDPTDDSVPEKSIVYLPVDSEGRTVQNKSLALEQWQTLELAWDLGKKECWLHVDGRKLCQLPLNAYSSEGVNYLQLRSRASSIDNRGFLIESVKVSIKDGAIPIETKLRNK
jgi:hypothetical protein